MNIPLMKYTDEYLGRIICFILSLGKSIKITVPAADSVKKILLIKFWGMGSIILTSPAITAVKKNFPDAKIYFLSFSTNTGILKLIPGVDEIISVKLTNPISFFIDTIKTIFKLRKTKFDLVFDFEFFTYYSAIIIRLIKAKYTVGFDNHKNKRNRLFSETVLFNNHIHTRDNFVDLVHSVCGDLISELKLFNISPCKAEGLPQGMWEIQRGFYLKGTIITTVTLPYIVINPNASKMAYERRLPADYFVKIIDELSAEGRFQIILTGSVDEKTYVSAIFNKLITKDKVTDLSGKLNVNELVSLINNSVCLVTNDSGPLHIASALNKPVIAFYGPESPVRYGPLSSKQLVFYRALECSPCMSISNSKTVNCIYNEPKCMTGFDVNEIIVKIKEFLVSLQGSPPGQTGVWKTGGV